MKIKKAMRILAMLVIFSILLATTIFAAPARASAYLSAYYANITKTSSGDLSIHFQVIAPAIMDQLGVSRISVQRYTGSYWRTEYNFTYPETPELQGKDVGIYSETVLYTPQYPDSRYRAVVTFYASNSSGSDTGSFPQAGVSPLRRRQKGNGNGRSPRSPFGNLRCTLLLVELFHGKGWRNRREKA